MPPKGSRGRDRGGRGRGRRRSAAGLATGTDVGRESPPTQTPLLTLHTYPPAYPSDSASPYRPLTLLVIGPQPHTSKLSNSIYTAAKHLTNVDLEVREIPSLTWLMRPDDERRRQIDVVVFVIDTSDRPGFAQFKHEVGLLGLEYYMGRCCVVTHSDNGNEIGHVERDELEEWISSISDNIPHFHTSTHNATHLQFVASHIVKCAEIAGGFTSLVSPLIAELLLEMRPMGEGETSSAKENT